MQSCMPSVQQHGRYQIWNQHSQVEISKEIVYPATDWVNYSNTGNFSTPRGLDGRGGSWNQHCRLIIDFMSALDRHENKCLRMRWESYNPIVNSLEILLNWINPIISQNNHIIKWHSIAVWLSIPFPLFDWAEVSQSILSKIRDSSSGVAAKSPPRLNGNTSARYLADDVSGRQNMLKSWYWKPLDIEFSTEKDIGFNWCVCESTTKLVVKSF
jgi:hypothetical protein